jgi:hypothetical protein
LVPRRGAVPRAAPAGPDGAHVPHRAELTVVAGEPLVGGLRHAGVGHLVADPCVALVPGRGTVGWAAATAPGCAGIATGAELPVIAGGPIGHVRVAAAQDRIAQIRGAGVSVITVEGRAAAETDAQRALVDRGAGVTVIARRTVWSRRILAAAGGQTTVDRTELAIVAVERRAAGAGSELAAVGGRASVSVVAGGTVGQVDVRTARDRVAAVGRALVAVVAVEGGAARADAGNTGVRRGAGIRAVVQASESLQAVPFALLVFWQPAPASQVSTVHWFPSSQLGGVPAVQTPS